LVPRVLVLNKVDIAEQGVVDQWLRLHPEGLPVSAKTGLGLEALTARIEKSLTSDMEEIVLTVPHSDYAIIPLLHREGSVIEEKTEDEFTIVKCRIPRRLEVKVEKFRR